MLKACQTRLSYLRTCSLVTEEMERRLRSLEISEILNESPMIWKSRRFKILK